MRILYGAGNRIGANSQLCRFLQAVGDQHEIKKAAFVQASYSLPHVDWTLDALYHNILGSKRSRKIQNLFGHSGVPMVNLDNVTIFLQEVEKFDPDLIISDGEPISAHIAKTLNIKLWYCSPIHLLDGIQWGDGQIRYVYLLHTTRRLLLKFPEPDKIFVYSPFGDIKFRPILNPGYEWLTPYHLTSSKSGNDCVAIVNDHNRFSDLSKILNGSNFNITLFSPFKEEFSNMKTGVISDLKLSGFSSMFTTGETSYLSDAFYSGYNVCIAPTLNDVESLLNAILIKEYKLGTDVHQVELMEHLSLDEIEKAIDKPPRSDYLSKQNYPYLHEKIKELII